MIAVGLVAVCLILAVSASAVGNGPLRVTMDDAVALTLQRNPAVRIAWESVDIGEGRLRASSGAFDWLVLSEATAVRVRTPESGANVTTARREELNYSLGVQRLFRNGIAVAPNVSVTVTKDAIEEIDASGSTAGRADVLFSILVPLLRGWGTSSTGASSGPLPRYSPTDRGTCPRD